MKGRSGILSFALALAFASGASVAGVKSVDTAPVLDGRLDDAVWAQADWESGFQRFNTVKKSRVPSAQTEFAILADADNLYLGARAHHPKMDGLKSLGSQPIWEAEAVEFYFVPDGGTFEYYQFLLTYQGMSYAQFYSEGGNIKPDPYGPKWEMKVSDAEGGWTVEARIPLSAFYMTRGDAWGRDWKVNVARSYREPGKFDFNCWIDGKGYADLKNFRTISGFPMRKAVEDIWVKSVVPTVRGPKDGALEGSLKLGIYSAEAGEATVTTSFSKPVKAVLPRRGVVEVEVQASFPENGRLRPEVSVVRPSGRCERVYPVVIDYRPIRLKLASPAYRGNFYPGQDSDRVAGSVMVAAAGKASVVLEGPGFGRREQTLPDRGGEFSFDTKGFAEGAATLTVTAGTNTLTRTIRKLAPFTDGRHMSWVENGCLVVDGKPVLRRNMYAEYYMGGEAFKRKYDADDLHQTKWLTCIGTLEPMRLIRGIEQREATRDVRPCDEIFAKVDAVIEQGLGKSKGSYYYISDEPECRGLSPVYLKHIYDYVCEKDPYHVVLTCSRAGERYIDCADWFETHPYINAHYDQTGKRVYGRAFNELGDYISAFNPERHSDKVVGGTATCFSYSSGTYPTFTEYIANAWCEFLRGARSLFPYAYHDLGDRASLYEGTRYLFSSAEALEPLLLHGVRKTLAKTSEYEAALWTLPNGARMFAIQNFTTGSLEASVPGLSGSFREFRGKRKFDLSAVRPSTFVLKPLESLVATTKAYDEGLPTFAETQAKIDALENERLGRPNQLLGRHQDIEVTTSTPGGGGRKMFDGTRDVIAWGDAWGKDKFYEMAFPSFVPEFSEMSVYGFNIEGMRVKVREGGEWKELAPVSTEKGEFSLRYVFDRKYSTVKLRLEFPKNKVELYEIELPGRSREVKAKAAGDLLKKKRLISG